MLSLCFRLPLRNPHAAHRKGFSRSCPENAVHSNEDNVRPEALPRMESSLRERDEKRATVNKLLESATLTDEIIRAIVSASHDAPGQQNDIAWRLVARGQSSQDGLKLAIALATDAVRTDGGTNFATLDTLAVALHKSERKRDAAHIASRVISVCDLVGNDRCEEEHSRAVRYIADAIETH